ncbi:MAG: TIGR04133 family radical SAM/SPASM protein [Prevotella sp.]|nr:TIGR04133 family radical SAM/SPASM protein [Prevotella sp.]
MKLSTKQRIGLEATRLIHKNLANEHPLRQLFWESTLRCNLNCRHCGSDCKAISGTKDMPLDDFLRVLDSISERVDPHKVFVIVTGGEPLMRTDIEHCGREIYRKGFPWGMVSNGLALTSGRLEGLLQAGVHTMAISLDGLHDNHNWLRRHEKSFDAVENAIDLLTHSPIIDFDIVTCVTQKNYEELPALRDFLIQKGVRKWRLFSVFPAGRAMDEPLLQLENRQMRGLMSFIKSTREDGKIKASYGCEGFLGGYEGKVRNHFFFCNAGITVGSVLADGSISACASIRSDYSQGNIYKDDFMDVWEHRYGIYRKRDWMKSGECEGCRMFRYCNGNGMHLRDDDGRLLTCHYKRLINTDVVSVD